MIIDILSMWTMKLREIKQLQFPWLASNPVYVDLKLKPHMQEHFPISPKQSSQ